MTKQVSSACEGESESLGCVCEGESLESPEHSVSPFEELLELS